MTPVRIRGSRCCSFGPPAIGRCFSARSRRLTSSAPSSVPGASAPSTSVACSATGRPPSKVSTTAPRTAAGCTLILSLPS
uniref:Uncharacterized protein n=1 Tax=Macrostomum lignano TaxID=282301 RepID=A0A1I8GUY6_9PLAT